MTDPYFLLPFGENYSLILPGQEEPDMEVRLSGGVTLDPRGRTNVLTLGYLRTDELAQKGYPPVLTLEEIFLEDILRKAPDSPQCAAIRTNYGLPPNPEVVPVVVEKPNWQLLGRITVGVLGDGLPIQLLHGKREKDNLNIAVPFSREDGPFIVCRRYPCQQDSFVGGPSEVLEFYRFCVNEDLPGYGTGFHWVCPIQWSLGVENLGICKGENTRQPRLGASKDGIYLDAQRNSYENISRRLFRDPEGLVVKIDPLTNGYSGKVCVRLPGFPMRREVYIDERGGITQITLGGLLPSDVFSYPKGAYVSVSSRGKN